MNSTFYTVGPYVSIAVFFIGLMFIISSNRERLTNKQLKRIKRLFDTAEVRPVKQRFVLLDHYQNWIKQKLSLIGYTEKLKDFYSLMRAVFLFFFFAVSGISYFSGFEVLTSIRIGIIASVISLSIPHIVLFYLLAKRKGVISKEFITVSNYIYESMDGKQKDLFNAIKESLGLVTFLNLPLQRLLNRYNTVGPLEAYDEFLLEVPLSEAEQFITLISNGFEYRDQLNMLSFIKAIKEAKNSLAIAYRKRRQEMYKQIYSILIIAPALLTIVIIIYCTGYQAQKVLTQTTF